MGIAAVYGGWQRYEAKRLVEDTPTENVRSMAAGRIGVTGRARAVDEPIRPTFGGGKAVVASYEIEEYESSGKHSSWRTKESGTLAAPFLLDDGTGDRSTAYFEWPPSDGSPLDRLLAAVGLDRDSFADLHGRQSLVRIDDGHLLPVVPPASAGGSRHGRAGIVAGHLANVVAVVGAVLGVVDPLTLFVALLSLNLVALPTATYLDAWHVKRTTDWDHAPSFWATLAVLPLVNVVSTALYLRSRRAARPIVER